MISRLKNNDGPTSLQAAITAAERQALPAPGSRRARCLCAFSTMTMAASVISAMARAIPARLMILELMPSKSHGDEGDQHADGEHDDRHQRAAHMHEKDGAYQRDDDDLFDKHLVQRGDGAVDQIGAVVDGLNRDLFRQARGDFADLVFNVAGDVQRIFAMARDHDARDHLPFAVELGYAPPLVGNQFDAGDIPQQHRRALFRLDDEIFKVADAAQVAFAAHHIFRFRHLDHASAYVPVACGDDLGYFTERYAVGLQPPRVDRNLVASDKSAHARHFRYSIRSGQLITQNQSWMARNSSSACCFATRTY